MTASSATGGAATLRSASFLADMERQPQVDVATMRSAAAVPRLRRAAADGSITVLIAASGSPQALGALQAAAAVEEGVHSAMPSARVLKLPDVGPGAGFVDGIVRLAGGAIARIGLLGPRGEGIAGRLGLLGPPGDLTAVIAIEEAIELRRLPPEKRDPTGASSRHAGQLILAALERGVRRIIIGLGDSGANDGGIGMASVLGIRFLDATRTEIAEAGGLLRLATVDMTHRDRRLDSVSIEAVVNPCNDLLGPHGVTRVHGARIGASQAQVLRLERGLARYAEVVHGSLGIDVAELAGGGASGGLGAGLVAFAGARLRSRHDFLQACPGLQEVLGRADLVITVDDRIHPPGASGRPEEAGEADAAGLFSRVPAWVARQAQVIGLPVIALTGDPLFDPAATVALGDPGALPAVRAALAGGEQAARHASSRLRDASATALRRLLSGWNRAAEQT